MPKSLTDQLFNTNDLSTPFFRCIFYGETDSRKTTTAARFGSPDETRIVLVRRPEQMTPLKGLGYTVFLAKDAQDFASVVQDPASVFGEPWAKNPNRTLVIDDITEAKDFLMESNESTVDNYGNVHEVRDTRKVVKGAKDDMRSILKSALDAPQHLIVTALSRTIENPAADEERITVDLPPSISSMFTTDFEYVFYSLKAGSMLPQWQCLTSTETRGFKKIDEKGKEVTYSRSIFAKSKLPLPVILSNPTLLPVRANADLRAIWNSILAAQAKPKKAARG